MRRNFFGEAYCSTAAEVEDQVAAAEGAVYISCITAPDPHEENHNFVGEVVKSDSGELVCYIEAATREAVQAIAYEAKLDGADGV